MIDTASAQSAFQNVAIGTALVTAVAAIGGALKSGLIKELRFGPVILEGWTQGPRPLPDASIARDDRPFETTALSSYYNHALIRANISFWFSLIFAAIGFGVIIFAFATHDKTDVVGTVIKAVSGTVIDAVSGLFFVQSTNAQKSMGEFFEKLRLDRMNADARGLINEIENPERRDQLRAQLVLKYAAIETLVVG